LPRLNNTLNVLRAGSGDLNPVRCQKAHPLCGCETCGLCGTHSAAWRVAVETGCRAGVLGRRIPIGVCPRCDNGGQGVAPTPGVGCPIAFFRILRPIFCQNAPVPPRYPGKTARYRRHITQTRPKIAEFAVMWQPSGHTSPVAAFGRNREAG
jgi:hypothetical protein